MQSSNSKVEDKSCLSISKSSIKSGKSVDLSLAPSFGKQSSVFSPISIKSKSNSKIAQQQQEIHKILNEQSEIHESRAPSAKKCKQNKFLKIESIQGTKPTTREIVLQTEVIQLQNRCRRLMGIIHKSKKNKICQGASLQIDQSSISFSAQKSANMYSNQILPPQISDFNESINNCFERQHQEIRNEFEDKVNEMNNVIQKMNEQLTKCQKQLEKKDKACVQMALRNGELLIELQKLTSKPIQASRHESRMTQKQNLTCTQSPSPARSSSMPKRNSMSQECPESYLCLEKMVHKLTNALELQVDKNMCCKQEIQRLCKYIQDQEKQIQSKNQSIFALEKQIIVLETKGVSRSQHKNKMKTVWISTEGRQKHHSHQRYKSNRQFKNNRYNDYKQTEQCDKQNMMSNANVMLHKSTSVLPKKRGELSASTKCEWMSRSAMRMPVSPTNRCPEYYQNSGNNYSLNKPRPSMIASTQYADNDSLYFCQ